MPPAPTARRRFLHPAGVALLLVLVTPSPATTAASQTLAPEVHDTAIARINEYRADNGRSAVVVDQRLKKAALRHARAMADRDFFSHVGADGSDMGKRATEAGYVWKLVAENIAAGMPGPAEAIESWIDSPGHRRNLLLKGAVHAGLAHVRIDPDPGAINFKDYWVLLLAAPQ